MVGAQRFSGASARALQSAQCYYRDDFGFAYESLVAQLTPDMPAVCDAMPLDHADRATGFKDALGRALGGPYDFDGYAVTRWTSHHWEIPIVAVLGYLAMIFGVKRAMAGRPKMLLQPVVVAWNFGLSAFSFLGLYYTVPQLLLGPEAGLLTQGFYPSVCSHASSYGFAC